MPIGEVPEQKAHKVCPRYGGQGKPSPGICRPEPGHRLRRPSRRRCLMACSSLRGRHPRQRPVCTDHHPDCRFRSCSRFGDLGLRLAFVGSPSRSILRPSCWYLMIVIGSVTALHRVHAGRGPHPLPAFAGKVAVTIEHRQQVSRRPDWGGCAGAVRRNKIGWFPPNWAETRPV